MKIFKYVVFISVLFLPMTGISAFAQDQDEAMDEMAASEPQKAEETAAMTSGNVTLDFKDADIMNVLRILSYKSGVNIVAGQDVSGPITIRLTDVPWEKALEVILRTYGYTYERE
ncbi:MAG: hypothetical protein KKH08_06665, partial [Candidatus Omnitrophica bacterium]|nr:hypothetical protein [Candidatus Omnitrophota bacterium]